MYDQHVDSSRSNDNFHTLTVRVRSSLYNTVERIAKAEGETVSAMVRDMLRRGIEQRQAAR